MSPSCPKCGSHNVRHAHLRSPAEKVGALLGVRPMRCRDCRARFPFRTWHVSQLRYARCPKCLRTNLTHWSPSHYHVTFGKAFMMFFGASPYRCDACRYNFVSLRRRKRSKKSRPQPA